MARGCGNSICVTLILLLIRITGSLAQWPNIQSGTSGIVPQWNLGYHLRRLLGNRGGERHLSYAELYRGSLEYTMLWLVFRKHRTGTNLAGQCSLCWG